MKSVGNLIEDMDPGSENGNLHICMKYYVTFIDTPLPQPFTSVNWYKNKRCMKLIFKYIYVS